MELQRFAQSFALVAVLGLTAAAASAQTGFRGKFELPAQAYWNNTLLPAGDYTLAVDYTPTGVSLFTVRGDGIKGTFLASGSGSEEGSGKNVLKLESVNGTYVIRALDSGSLNTSYKFAVAKSVKQVAFSGQAQPPVTVAVNGR